MSRGRHRPGWTVHQPGAAPVTYRSRSAARRARRQLRGAYVVGPRRFGGVVVHGLVAVLLAAVPSLAAVWGWL